jgi:4-hydroxybenzoate polyprenyltransferase
MSIVNFMCQYWPRYMQLLRLDRPIGTYLLLWPTLWGLWLAAEGWPDLYLLIIFTVGTVLMRAAGCVVNDFADRNLDTHVKRTASRPMAIGLVSVKQAWVLFTILILLAFGLVLLTNPLTLVLSLVGLVLVVCYPFMKRYTHWPQVLLGAAFAWSIPMGYASQTNSLPIDAWLTFGAAVCLTTAYDTFYAMVDRDDDIKIGIKSTAILFGRWDLFWIGAFQVLCLLLLLAVAVLKQLGPWFYVGWLAMLASFVYQHRIAHGRSRQACFKAFLNNHWSALLLLAGLVINYT